MILCCGEALIDMVPERIASGAFGYVPRPGGAVFNTAIALGRLGAAAGMLTGLSRDLFGQQLDEALAGSNVDRRFILRTDRPTTLAFVALDDGQASYTFYDENSAGRMLSAGDMPRLPKDVTALFFGGISLACEPGAEAYRALAERGAEGRAVMLDPNIRPGFIADEARYRDRLEAMIALADIVKVSDEDLAWIMANGTSLDAQAETLLERGPSLLIVTRGSAGARLYLRGGARLNVPAERARVVDTIGAGDTFNAGVLAHLAGRGLLTKSALRDLPPDAGRAALAFGARVAAVTVSRAGANPPWADEL
ncbi:carbohydrate kinase [Marivita sp. GX14005]|uniref:carbohydrate kinase family protein n=1 Tax=Marivita sp. GX14005 TaxID=2942276 RepID=UPI002018617D|nr:carbohydrate kinase [Marivita sp. GX14005]MCL3882694.1 carbohydrate kinase [Marivita sp. GX14005]